LIHFSRLDRVDRVIGRCIVSRATAVFYSHTRRRHGLFALFSGHRRISAAIHLDSVPTHDDIVLTVYRRAVLPVRSWTQSK